MDKIKDLSIDDLVLQSAKKLLDSGSYPSIKKIRDNTLISTRKIRDSIVRLDQDGIWPTGRRKATKLYNQDEIDLLRKLIVSAERTKDGVIIISSIVRKFYHLTGRLTSTTQIRCMLNLPHKWVNWKSGIPFEK